VFRQKLEHERGDFVDLLVKREMTRIEDEPANPQMAALVDAGVDPAFVADRVLAGIRNNELYILTHPELRGAVAGRFDQIMAAFDTASLQAAALPAA